MLAHKHEGVLEVEVVVVGQVADVHEALDAVRQLEEDAEVRDAHDRGREARADLLLRPAGVEVAGQVALGLLGHPLALADELGELREVGAHPLLERGRQAVLQHGAHRAVHHQVGVAADGAREVQVAGEREAEVAQVLARVARLLEAAQQQRVNQLRLGLAGRLLQDRLQVLRARVLEVEGVAELAQRLLQGRDLLLARVLVDAEQGGDLALRQLLRHHAVRQQHQLFDELPRRVGADGRDLQRALLVDVDLRLGEAEVERARVDTRLAQLLREVKQHLDVALELALAGGEAAAVGELLHLPVGQARVRLDDGLLELEALHYAVTRDVDEHRQRQARLPLLQRADAVGELFGKHGQHAAGEVDARGALDGFLVERRALGDVVADVGDVNAHAQHPVAGAVEALDRDGVVEVLRVLAVDGHGGDLAVVGAAGHHLGRHVVGHRLGLGHGVVVELGLQAVLDDDGARLDLGVARIAQELQDLAERLLLARDLGPHHAHHDARAALELAHRLGGQQDALAQADAVGPQDRVAARVLERADHLVVAALDDAHDLAAGPVVVALLGAGARHDAVAVPRATQAVGGDEQVAAARVGDDEAVTARGDLQPPHDEVHLLRKPVGAAPGADELAAVDEVAQQRAQPAAVVQLQAALDVLDVPGALGMIMEEAQHLGGIDIWHPLKCSAAPHSGRVTRRKPVQCSGDPRDLALGQLGQGAARRRGREVLERGQSSFCLGRDPLARQAVGAVQAHEFRHPLHVAGALRAPLEDRARLLDALVQQQHQHGVGGLPLAQVAAHGLAQRVRVAQQVEVVVLHLERPAVGEGEALERRQRRLVGAGQQAHAAAGRDQQRGGLPLDDPQVVVETVVGERRHLELEHFPLADGGGRLGHQPGELGAARARQQAQHARQHEVARHDADDVAVAPEGGLGAAARVGVVDQVVVQQRGRVEQLHRQRRLHGRLFVGRQQLAGEEGEGWTEALAARRHEVVADRLDEGDVRGQLLREALLEAAKVGGDDVEHGPTITALRRRSDAPAVSRRP